MACDVVTLTAIRARWLPRQLILLPPLPYLELHLTPGGVPALSSPAQARTTDPVFRSFTHTASLAHACGPVDVVFVVRDAASADARIGTARISLDAAHVEGWFPLSDSGAELYVVLTRSSYCAERWSDCPRAPPAPMGRRKSFLRAAAAGELRTVSKEVGMLFREGEMRVSVEALDVPVGAKEASVTLQLGDQLLWGAETQESAKAWRKRVAWEGREEDDALRPVARAASAAQDVVRKASESHKVGAAVAMVTGKSERVLGKVTGARNGGNNLAAEKLHHLFAAAGSYANTLGRDKVTAEAHVSKIGAQSEPPSEEEKGKVAPEAPEKPEKNGANDTWEELPLQIEEHGQGEGGEGREGDLEGPEQSTGITAFLQSTSELVESAYVGSDCELAPSVGEGEEDEDDSDDEDEEEKEEKEGKEGEGESDLLATKSEKEAPTKQQTAESAAQDLKRHVHFGSFRFAVMHGIAPRMMYIKLVDNAAPLPAPLGLFQEHHIRIPKLADLKCTCEKQCKTHVFRLRLNGLEYGRVTLLLRIEYTHWKPLATSTDVTNRFLEIFSRTDKLPGLIHSRFPKASTYRYLLVGGLFTQHYPTYFEKNIHYLKEKLGFRNVEEVPIHTEGSIQRNARDIHEAIMKSNPKPKSVILIGHSKGGVDAAEVVKRFPDVVPFLHGILSFQAPFGGTYLVDFVSKSRIAAHTIAGAIEKLARGDEAAFADMGYSSRFRSLGIYRKIVDTRTESSHSDRDSDAAVESSDCPPFATRSTDGMHALHEESLDYLRSVPMVAFASRASFDVLKIRSAATAAGVATMAPAAQVISQHTGYSCDGLVTAHDARFPFADNVMLDDMMHTEPALYVKGTNYPPGQLTASGLLLLFERAAREG